MLQVSASAPLWHHVLQDDFFRHFLAPRSAETYLRGWATGESPRSGLNRRPVLYESTALPLSYSGGRLEISRRGQVDEEVFEQKRLVDGGSRHDDPAGLGAGVEGRHGGARAGHCRRRGGHQSIAVEPL